MVLPASEIATAVETEDTGRLMSLPEIGKRLATQIIAELKGKVAKFARMEKDKDTMTPVKLRRDPFILEALDILTDQLQYRRTEAEDMIAKTLTKNPSLSDTESLIREIFIQQGKKSGIVFRGS
jgi:Holliday junction resolvasome RuvABC DNA-binding subunit